jgi:hypothetical protein
MVTAKQGPQKISSTILFNKLSDSSHYPIQRRKKEEESTSSVK